MQPENVLTVQNCITKIVLTVIYLFGKGPKNVPVWLDQFGNEQWQKSSDKWAVTKEQWQKSSDKMSSDKWAVTKEQWQKSSEKWAVTNEQWQMSSDKKQMASKHLFPPR